MIQFYNLKNYLYNPSYHLLIIGFKQGFVLVFKNRLHFMVLITKTVVKVLKPKLTF